MPKNIFNWNKEGVISSLILMQGISYHVFNSIRSRLDELLIDIGVKRKSLRYEKKLDIRIKEFFITPSYESPNHPKINSLIDLFRDNGSFWVIMKVFGEVLIDQFQSCLDLIKGKEFSEMVDHLRSEDVESILATDLRNRFIQNIDMLDVMHDKYLEILQNREIKGILKSFDKKTRKEICNVFLYNENEIYNMVVEIRNQINDHLFLLSDIQVDITGDSLGADFKAFPSLIVYDEKEVKSNHFFTRKIEFLKK